MTFKKTLLVVTAVFFLLSAGGTQAAEDRRTLGDALPSLNNTVIPKTGLTEKNLDSQAALVVKGILSAMALVFFGLMVYSGIVWMTARGEEDRITKARETIIAAIIGLIIVVAAYAVTNLVSERIIRGIT